jgi:hypothetical protein
VVNDLLIYGGYTVFLARRPTAWKGLMHTVRDPLLVIWEAMNLLDEVGTSPDAPQLHVLLTDAEGALCRLTIELAKRAISQDPSGSQPGKIMLH